MSELPPYDSSFDLGGLPGAGPPVGEPAEDALFPREGTFGSPPGPAAPAGSEDPAPAAPPPVTYRPPASVPGPAYPPVTPPPPPRPPWASGGSPPRPGPNPWRAPAGTARPPARAARLVVGLLAGVVAIGLGLGRGFSDGAGSQGSAADEGSFPTWVDPGFGSSDEATPEVADTSMSILGTGLPNSAEAVRIVVLGTSDGPVDYTVDADGELSRASATGNLTERLDFATSSRVVVTRDDGENLWCTVYIDEDLVATSPEAGSPECVYDAGDIAAALPGE